MKASEDFKIQGYLQLFMAFWPKGHPDVKFYMAMNFDFTKPVTEDVLKSFLEASGKLCEEQYPGIEFEGEYITEGQSWMLPDLSVQRKNDKRTHIKNSQKILLFCKNPAY